MLSGYWPLNEESGDALDYSRKDNHASVSSGVSQGANGILAGKSYDFNSSGYMTIPYRDIYYREDLTLCMWMNLDSTNRISGSMQRHIDTRTPDSWDDGYVFQSDDDRDMSFNIPGVGDVSTNSMNSGTWHHVCGTFSRDEETLKLYIDGEIKEAKNVSGNISNSNRSIRVSERSDVNGEETAGRIMELRIYSRPLTDAEVNYIYTASRRGLQTTSKKIS